MDSLERLNLSLNTASYLLDSAAGQIRDAALSPTKEHIHKVGEALVAIFEIQQAIYKIRPELESQYKEVTDEISNANRRLGETLIAAYELADSGRVNEGVALLAEYERAEISDHHRQLASLERERLTNNYGT